MKPIEEMNEDELGNLAYKTIKDINRLQMNLQIIEQHIAKIKKPEEPKQ